MGEEKLRATLALLIEQALRGYSQTDTVGQSEIKAVSQSSPTVVQVELHKGKALAIVVGRFHRPQS